MNKPKAALLQVLGRLLSQSLGKKVRIHQARVTPHDVIGKFRYNRNPFYFQCQFTGNRTLELSYMQAGRGKTQRRDQAEIRLDAKKKCKTGVPCGDTCIEQGDVCRLGRGGQLLTKAQVGKLENLAAEASAPDTFSNMSIRQLKAAAGAAEIYKYGSLNKQELKKSLRAVHANPEVQVRIRKTLEKRKQRERAIAKALPQGYAKAYKNMRKISKVAGINPEYAAVLAATAITGFTAHQYLAARGRYKDNLQLSADIAMQRAKNVDTQKVRGSSGGGMMFAVGGFSNMGGSADALEAMMQRPQDDSPMEQWLAKSQTIIKISHPANDAKRPVGVGPIYHGQVMLNGFGQSLRNLAKGQNDPAIDIAARIYANGARNPKARLNVLAHGIGGNNVRAAGEILRRMKPKEKGLPSGEEVFKRLNVMAIGTPYFGFSNDRAWGSVPFRTLASWNDPLTRFMPKKMPEFIDSVKGHTVDDYMRNPEVRDRIAEQFGYFKKSLRSSAQRARQLDEFMGDLTTGLKTVSPVAGRTVEALYDVAKVAHKNKLAAGLTAAGLIAYQTPKQIARSRKHYDKNVKWAAGKAFQAQAKLTPVASRSNQTMVAVGGGGYTGEQVQVALANAEGLTKTQKTAIANQTTIAIDVNSDMTQPVPEGVAKGSLNHVAHQVSNGFGNVMSRIRNRGKSNDAINLAAKVYAQAQAEQLRVSGDGDQTRLNAPINLVAYAEGGLVAREAMDILKQMPKSDKLFKEGEEQIRLVTIGTPSFGLSTGKYAERNFIGSSDFVRRLPFLHKDGGQTVIPKGVASHDLKDYAASEDFAQAIAAEIADPKSADTRTRKRVLRNQAGQNTKNIMVRSELFSSMKGAMPVPQSLPGWDGFDASVQDRATKEYYDWYKAVDKQFNEEQAIAKFKLGDGFEEGGLAIMKQSAQKAVDAVRENRIEKQRKLAMAEIKIEIKALEKAIKLKRKNSYTAVMGYTPGGLKEAIANHPGALTLPNKLEFWGQMQEEERVNAVRRTEKWMATANSLALKRLKELEASKLEDYTPGTPAYDKMLARLKQRAVDFAIEQMAKTRTDAAQLPSLAYLAGSFGIRLDKVPDASQKKKDLSKLQKKQITNKQGEKQTVYVSREQAQSTPGRNQQAVQAAQTGSKLVQQGQKVANIGQQAQGVAKAVSENVADPQAAVNATQMAADYVRRHGPTTESGEFEQQLVQAIAHTYTTEDLPSKRQMLKMATTAVMETLRNPVRSVQKGLERERIAKEAWKARFGEDAPTKAAVIADAAKGVGKAAAGVVLDKEVLVAMAGLGASVAGGAVAGPAGAVAADLGGALVMRKVVEAGEAYIKARKPLLENQGQIQAEATKLAKLAEAKDATLSELKSPEMQQQMEGDFIADTSGWAIGNGVATAVGTIVPMLGREVPTVGATIPSAIPMIGSKTFSTAVPFGAGAAMLGVPLVAKPIISDAVQRHRQGADVLDATTQAVTHYVSNIGGTEAKIREKATTKIRGLKQQGKDLAQSVATDAVKGQAKEVAVNAAKSLASKVDLSEAQKKLEEVIAQAQSDPEAAKAQIRSTIDEIKAKIEAENSSNAKQKEKAHV